MKQCPNYAYIFLCDVVPDVVLVSIFHNFEIDYIQFWVHMVLVGVV